MNKAELDDVQTKVVCISNDTIEISVPEALYSKTKRILLNQEGSHWGTLFYPDEDDEEKDCSTCKYGDYNDYWHAKVCYNGGNCANFNLWEKNEE